MASPFPASSMTPGSGHLHVVLLPSGASFLQTMSFQYPLKLISPSPSTPRPAAVVFLLSYGGGLVGGDRVRLSARLDGGARLAVVTQGHTKVFRPTTSPPAPTTQALDVRVARGAALCLLPDPVQPFEGSVYEQTQAFRLEPGAALCLLDWVTQGRAARGEDWSLARWRGRNEVWAVAAPGTVEPTTTGLGNGQPPPPPEAQQPPAQERLLVRDVVILDAASCAAATGKDASVALRDSMRGLAVVGTLVLRGPQLAALSNFFLAEFAALPRLGGRDFRTDAEVRRDEEAEGKAAGGVGSGTEGQKGPRRPTLQEWRRRRLKQEQDDGVLWSAAKVRGCVVVKFGAKTVEGGRVWIGGMLAYNGLVKELFGEDALMCVRP